MSASYIYQDMSHAKRVEMLRKLCKGKEQITYTKTLSDSELNSEKDIYTRDAMRIAQLEDEMKSLAASYKGKINAIKKSNIERLDIIANQKKQVFGMTYAIADTANDRMLFYDEDGELVNSREMLPNEKQGSLFLGENQQTANDKPLEVVKNVLDEFPDAVEVKDEDIQDPEYEPSVQEEAPDESDLENLENIAPFPVEEDWRPDELKNPEPEVKAEKPKRAPRKKKDL